MSKKRFDPRALLGDVKIAAALATITRHCGAGARRFLLSAECRLTKEDILKISRVARDRQRYELKQVIKGRRPFQKPKYGTPPLDTEKYSELPSRLGRAWGHVNKVIRSLSHLRKRSSAAFGRVDIPMPVVNDLARNSRTLSKMLSKIPARGRSPVNKPKPPSTKRLKPKKIRGALAVANGFIAKNLRDIPRLPSNVVPTPEQKRYIQRRLAEIRLMCGTLRALADVISAMRARQTNRG